MSPKLRVLLVLSFAIGFASVVSAQYNPPDNKQRKVRTEPKTAFTEWPNQDVSLIITNEERRAYAKLKTDEEREQFINHFWSLRDPDPDTVENEYREEYYERIAYANEHFSSGKAGWLTDRGRIYVKFGKPDEIESHPSGGAYQRQPHEGYGTATTYPFERWFYRYLAGVGSGIEIEFVDPTGSGEYRIARDIKEKELSFSGTPVSTITDSSSYRREQDSPFAVSDLHRRLDQAPEFKGNALGGLTDSPSVDDNPLDFEIGTSFFRQFDNSVVVAFVIQTDNSELVFQDVGGLQTARLNILGRILTVTQRRVGDFEDSLATTATTFELTEVKGRKSAYAKAVVLAPGRYRLDVRVRDVVSGAEGMKHFGFEVPKFESGKLATSSLVLAARLEQLQDEPAVGQFVIGNNKVIPSLNRMYRRGQPVGLYLQVYNAGIDQTTLRPAVSVEYVLSTNGKELNREIEDWRENAGSAERVILAKLIDSAKLMPGDYELTIRIRDHVSGQTLTPSAKFSVVE